MSTSMPCQHCKGTGLDPVAHELCVRCKGSGVKTFPWTGFTLEIDGDPESIWKVVQAFEKVLKEIVDDANYEIETESFVRPIATMWPVHGTVSYRSDKFDLRNVGNL